LRKASPTFPAVVGKACFEAKACVGKNVGFVTKNHRRRRQRSSASLVAVSALASIKADSIFLEEKSLHCDVAIVGKIFSHMPRHVNNLRDTSQQISILRGHAQISALLSAADGLYRSSHDKLAGRGTSITPNA